MGLERQQNAKEYPLRAQLSDILLRPDKALYEVGDTAYLEVLCPMAIGTVFLDVIRNQQTILTKSVDLKDGRGALTLVLSEDYFGTLDLHAYKILAGGEVVRDTRLIYVNPPRDLKVDITPDKPVYLPGEQAKIGFVVKNADGSGVVAALGVNIVDESVFALEELQPGLAKIYFALEKELMEPKYEICKHGIPELIREPEVVPTEITRQQVAKLMLASAPSLGEFSLAVDSQREKIRQAHRARESYFKGLVEVLYKVVAGLIFIIPVALFILGWAQCRWLLQPPIPETEQAAWALKRSISKIKLFYFLFLIVPLVLFPLCPALIHVIKVSFPSYDFYDYEGYLIGAGIALVVISALTMFALVILQVHQVLKHKLITDRLALRIALKSVPVVMLSVMAYFDLLVVRTAYLEFYLELKAIFLLFGMGFSLVLILPAMTLTGLVHLEKTNFRRAFKSAFKLSILELIVVLLIIVITAAILFPVFARAKEKARAVPMPGPPRGMPAAPGMPPAGPMPIMPPEKAAPKPAVETKEIRVRQFFPETLYSNPAVITDETGNASIELAMADTITTWRLSALASSLNGQLGAATKGIRAFQDFFIDIDLPVALTQNDEISIPVAIYNYLPSSQQIKLKLLEAPWFKLFDQPVKQKNVGKNEVNVLYFRLKAKNIGNHKLTVYSYGEKQSDAVTRPLEVVPDGKEIVEVINDRLEADVTESIDIPEEAIDGASKILLKVPGVFSQVVEGLESIFRMPWGCFEQTSSCTYPNVLVLDYLKRTKKTTPQIQMKAEGYINTGYQRLLTFEVQDGGFSLYGEPPAELFLSAYGLMEFNDMKNIYPIDESIIERTRNWLMAQQRADGSFGASLRETVYVTWALLEAGEKSGAIDRALRFITAHLSDTTDPYVLAICANALVSGAPREPVTENVLARLHELREEDEKITYWSPPGPTFVSSSGRSADVEATALTAYAFMKAGKYSDVVKKALNFLIQSKDPNGTWHSTQATILVLKALIQSIGGMIEYRSADIEVVISGKRMDAIKITPANSDVMQLVDLKQYTKEGENNIKLALKGKLNAFYQLSTKYYVPWTKIKKPKPEKQFISIDLNYDKTKLRQNDLMTANVHLKYFDTKPSGMVIVDLGIPPGFQVLPEYLEALRTKDIIERYELTHRQIIIYLNDLKPSMPLKFYYRLRAKFPIRAKTPASQVYKYYNPSVKDVETPAQVTVL